MIRTLRKLVKKINGVFIIVLLFVIYYPVIGLCFVIYKLTKLSGKKMNSNSYWLEPQLGKFDKDYFSSAY